MSGGRCADDKPTVERVERVDAFVDPTLHRNRTGWDELDVPAGVIELAEDGWAQVQALAAPENAQARSRLEILFWEAGASAFEVPELDRLEWTTPSQARTLLAAGQVPFLERIPPALDA